MSSPSVEPHKKIQIALTRAHTELGYRAWTKAGGISVYLRNGYHVIDGIPMHCVDIANITVNPKGTGRFRGLLDWLELQLRTEGGVVFVENVTEPRLRLFLLARDYIEQPVDPFSEFPSSFYLQVAKS
jgi:hypothetical protein